MAMGHKAWLGGGGVHKQGTSGGEGISKGGIRREYEGVRDSG